MDNHHHEKSTTRPEDIEVRFAIPNHSYAVSDGMAKFFARSLNIYLKNTNAQALSLISISLKMLATAHKYTKTSRNVCPPVLRYYPRRWNVVLVMEQITDPIGSHHTVIWNIPTDRD